MQMGKKNFKNLIVGAGILLTQVISPFPLGHCYNESLPDLNTLTSHIDFSVDIDISLDVQTNLNLDNLNLSLENYPVDPNLNLQSLYNHAVISQKGVENIAIIKQEGIENLAFLYQEGFKNYVEQIQTGKCKQGPCYSNRRGK